MPPVGFELTITAGERPQTYALDRAVTGTGKYTIQIHETVVAMIASLDLRLCGQIEIYPENVCTRCLENVTTLTRLDGIEFSMVAALQISDPTRESCTF